MTVFAFPAVEWHHALVDRKNPDVASGAAIRTTRAYREVELSTE